MQINEIQKIKRRYQKNKSKIGDIFFEKHKEYTNYLVNEREAVYTKVIHDWHGKNLRGVTLLEIGAGEGINIPLFYKLGLSMSDIWLNELLDDRIRVLKSKYSETNILPGNALDLKFREKFDIVFQSTVFSSILDFGFKQALASKMIEFLKPGGLILWYDFIYDNPFNRDVRGIPLKEIRKLFPDFTIHFQRVTFLPPLGRRLRKNVIWVNKFFPIFRTHIVAWGVKNIKDDYVG
jgi:SAM-dependent methyltransferase